MTATITGIDKSASSISFTVRTDGNTAGASSIRLCSIRLKVDDQVDITWDTNVTVAVQ